MSGYRPVTLVHAAGATRSRVSTFRGVERPGDQSGERRDGDHEIHCPSVPATNESVVVGMSITLLVEVRGFEPLTS